MNPHDDRLDWAGGLWFTGAFIAVCVLLVQVVPTVLTKWLF